MKKPKFYQSRLMLRAGRPQNVMRMPFSALHLQPNGITTVVAHANVCAFCRDHAGWPKAFAQAVADIHPTRLAIYQCEPEQAEQLAESMRLLPASAFFIHSGVVAL